MIRKVGRQPAPRHPPAAPFSGVPPPSGPAAAPRWKGDAGHAGGGFSPPPPAGEERKNEERLGGAVGPAAGQQVVRDAAFEGGG